MISQRKGNNLWCENFNWVDEGALGDIKDQKACGSCWAFSTVGNLEGLYHLKYKEDLRFSEQQLVDCDTYDSACDGGLMEKTFQWLKQNNGLGLESEYPYVGKQRKCSADQSKNKVKVASYI